MLLSLFFVPTLKSICEQYNNLMLILALLLETVITVTRLVIKAQTQLIVFDQITGAVM